MKRNFIIGLLAVGTIAGFSLGFTQMAFRHHHRRQSFEKHIANVCVDAALRTRKPDDRRPPPPPPRRRGSHHDHQHGQHNDYDRGSYDD
jgi:hypothetical protein